MSLSAANSVSSTARIASVFFAILYSPESDRTFCLSFVTWATLSPRGAARSVTDARPSRSRSSETTCSLSCNLTLFAPSFAFRADASAATLVLKGSTLTPAPIVVATAIDFR
jgi:hypothetical protein